MKTSGTTPSGNAGGSGGLPPLDEPIGVDEGPMRRELMRQISVLEREMALLVVNNAIWEPMQASPKRGPTILNAAELEQIRDELLAAITDLHQRILHRAGWDLDGPPTGRRFPRPRRRRPALGG
jgi:hypothetical protein